MEQEFPPWVSLAGYLCRTEMVNGREVVARVDIKLLDSFTAPRAADELLQREWEAVCRG